MAVGIFAKDFERAHMSVRIRMTRGGRKKRPFYRIVATERLSRRDGKYLELLGTFNPLVTPPEFKIKKENVLRWLLKGATASDTVRTLLQKNGIWADFAAQQKQVAAADAAKKPAKPAAEKKPKVAKPKAAKKAKADKPAKKKSAKPAAKKDGGKK